MEKVILLARVPFPIQTKFTLKLAVETRFLRVAWFGYEAVMMVLTDVTEDALKEDVHFLLASEGIPQNIPDDAEYLGPLKVHESGNGTERFLELFRLPKNRIVTPEFQPPGDVAKRSH